MPKSNNVWLALSLSLAVAFSLFVIFGINLLGMRHHTDPRAAPTLRLASVIADMALDVCPNMTRGPRYDELQAMLDEVTQGVNDPNEHLARTMMQLQMAKTVQKLEASGNQGLCPVALVFAGPSGTHFRDTIRQGY